MTENLVIGAGLWGCTVARCLADMGERVSLVDRRPYVGGNCATYVDDYTGIEVHRYGSHIFHTDDDEVWRFVSRFARFNQYRHFVMSCVGGEMYRFPICLDTINRVFGLTLTPGQAEEFINAGDGRQRLYDMFFRGYTQKQWGTDVVDASVISRIPVRVNYASGYFDDMYQGIPEEGYGKFFDNMVRSPYISVSLNTEFKLGDIGSDVRKVYYSGALDELFGYENGELPWRSLRFENVTVSEYDHQGVAVVNYPEVAVPYTRVHEFRHYHPEWKNRNRAVTNLQYEYPVKWDRSIERYYPVKSANGDATYRKYVDRVIDIGNVVVGGRIGSFQYFDMDDTIRNALDVVHRK